MLAATRMVAVGALAALVGAAPAPAAEVRATLGGVDVAAWTPEGGDETTRWPVVVFSHALGLCPAQARFLTTALAAAGYLVVAPYHADSACELSVNVADPARMALKPANLWTDADYRNRAEDVVRALGALSAGAEPGWRADATRVALVGHSLGGCTMLGLAGAWPSWPRPAGVRAVIAGDVEGRGPAQGASCKTRQDRKVATVARRTSVRQSALPELNVRITQG